MMITKDSFVIQLITKEPVRAAGFSSNAALFEDHPRINSYTPNPENYYIHGIAVGFKEITTRYGVMALCSEYSVHS